MSVAIDYEDYVQNHLVSLKTSDQAWMSDEARCSICIVEWDEEELKIVETHCGHLFHMGCILTWIEGHRQCPLCRITLWSVTKLSEDQEARDWVDPLPYFVRSLEANAVQDINHVLGDEFSEDIVQQHTGILLQNSNNTERFAQASRKLYERLIIDIPESDIKFLNIIRKSGIVERMLVRYDGDMSGQEWLTLVKELSICRNEIETLGDDTDNFPEGMEWSGIEVWSKMVRLNITAVLTIWDLDLPLGSPIATSYHRSSQLTNATEEAEDLNAVRRVKYIHQSGERKSTTMLRIALNHPDAISRMSISDDEREIEIYTSDGHRLSLSY